MVKLDAFDLRILALLQEDASKPLAEIADAVGLSPTPCWRRIQKLEAAGYIKQRVALLDRDKLRAGVTVFIAVKTARHSMEWLERFLSEYDLLVTPSTAIPAFAAGIEYPDPDEQRWSDWAGFSYPFNLSQQPALSVPAGFTKDGRPIGLQLVAAKYGDALVLRAGRAFEAACPQPMPTEPRGAVV